MEGNESIPATIFDELAGVHKIVNDKNSENVTKNVTYTPIDKKRLQKTSKSLFAKIQDDAVVSFKKVLKNYATLQLKEEIALIGKKKEKKQKKEKESEGFFKKTYNVYKKVKKAYDLYKKVKKAIKLLKKIKSIAKKTFNHIINILKRAARFIINLGKKITNTLVNAFKTLVKKFKPFISSIKKLFAVIKRIGSKIFNNMAKLVKAIWRIFSKLFFSGKASSKISPKEPPSQNFKNKSIPKNKNKLNLSLKIKNKKELSIWKYFKKGVKAVGKTAGRIIKTIFGKFIKFIVKKLRKALIKILFSLGITALTGGLAGPLMMVYNGISVVKDIYDAITFTGELAKDVSSMVSNAIKEFQIPKNESEDDEEKEEILASDAFLIESSDMDELKKYLYNFNKENKTSDINFKVANERYIKLLASSYELNGNETLSNRIKEFLSKSDINSYKSFADIEQKINEIIINYSKEKYQEKNKNIFTDEEINHFAAGESDGTPMWTSIWRDIVKFIQNNINQGVSIETFKNICEKTSGNILQPMVDYIKLNPDWRLKTNEEKDAEVAEGADKVNNNETYDHITASFKSQERFKDVLDKSLKYKFDAVEEISEYKIVKTKENRLQKEKANLWNDILQILSLNISTT